MGFCYITMNKYFRILFLALFFLPVSGHAQMFDVGVPDTSLTENNILYRRSYRGSVFIHSSGFGAGFRKSKNLNAFKTRFWYADLLYTKDLKEYKTTNYYYANAKSYVYGKLNDVAIARFGFGGERRMARKPYWGGVEVTFNYCGGFSLALAKPIYLYVVEYTGTSPDDLALVVRKFDPNNHFQENIYGRASFIDGLDELKPYPGVHAKAGFNFEFGEYAPVMKSLELGLAFDLFPVAVPILAFNDPENLFTQIYISIALGRRYN